MLEILTTILTEAGTQAQGFFDTLHARRIEAKAPGDLVSDADRAVEVTIRRLLAHHYPHDGILGEELGGVPTGRFWAVDPIDGTSNFLSGLPFWTISLGLMDAGQPVAGGILAPVLGLMAVTDGTTIRETGLSSGSRPTSPPCIGLGRNPRWPAADRHAIEAACAAAGLSPRLLGSCALSLMLVATHRLGGYIEPRVGGLWDCAAGLALCRAAGLATALRVHPDGTADVLAGDVGHLLVGSDWAAGLTEAQPI